MQVYYRSCVRAQPSLSPVARSSTSISSAQTIIEPTTRSVPAILPSTATLSPSLSRSSAAAETIALPGDLFPWRPRALTFGAEPGSAGRWHGTLAEIAVWNRPLATAEIAVEAARVRHLVAGRKSAARIAVEMRLRATSPVPALDEISPYREALAVDEFEIVRQLIGPPPGTRAAGTPAPGERIRVVRWAILDGQTLSAPTAGTTVRRTLEPFAAQPQLESYYLADRLPPQTGGTLYFDLGATAAP